MTMKYRPAGACCDPMQDLKTLVKEAYRMSKEAVKVVDVDGVRHYPNGSGVVSFDTKTEVIDCDAYYQLVCTITNGSFSSLSAEEGYWLLVTDNIYEMSGYYDLNESSSLAIADEGQNFLITTTG